METELWSGRWAKHGRFGVLDTEPVDGSPKFLCVTFISSRSCPVEVIIPDRVFIVYLEGFYPAGRKTESVVFIKKLCILGIVGPGRS